MTTTTREWSALQEAVFADAEHGTGHTFVLARAGTGKTTTITEAARRCRGSALVAAFSRDIAAEMKRRKPRRGVRVSTWHSYGLGALRKGLGPFTIDADKTSILLDQGTESAGKPPLDRATKGALRKACSLAKATLSFTDEQIGDLIADYGIDFLAGKDPKDAADAQRAHDRFVQQVRWLLVRSRKVTKIIDFDDMIWLPLVLRLRVPTFRTVFVDEAQDLNRCQIALARRAAGSKGRIIAVGDDRQAIYRFRGADENAVTRIITSLDAKVLPLSITYRCAKAIVEHVSPYVPDYEAHAGNCEGQVLYESETLLPTLAEPGDFVLSRTNAPLITACLNLVRAGVPAVVRGRDVGAKLMTVIDASEAASVAELAAWCAAWADREKQRVIASNPDADTETIDQTRDCIAALSEGAANVDEVRRRTREMFSDADDSQRVVCSSTHKAKGLERDRVFLLEGTFLTPRDSPAEQQEEENLYYVSCTRAKHSLTLLRAS